MIKKTPNLSPLELGPQQAYLFPPFNYEAGPSFEPDLPESNVPDTPEALAIDQAVQLTFLPEFIEAPVRKTVRAAFGRYVGPEHQDPFREHDFSKLSPEDKKWITSRFLADGLFPAKDENTRHRVGKINVNPYEYKIVIRSRDPMHLHNYAFNKTLGYDQPNDDLLDQAMAKGNDAIERKFNGMRAHAEAMRGSVTMLERLELRAKSPGRGHATDQDLREMYANAWYEFENMMNVVHVTNNWTDLERDRADTAFLYYLTQGAQYIRVKHWREMLSLAKAYTKARVELFSERIGLAAEVLIMSSGSIVSPEPEESSPAA